MAEDQKKYKYESDEQIFKELFVGFDDFFKPIFESFSISKKTFVLQVVNFILIFYWFYLLLGDAPDRLLTKINGSGVLGMRLLLLVVVVCGISLITKNKILRWQTLFMTKYELTQSYFWRILFLVALTYFGNKIYAKRH